MAILCPAHRRRMHLWWRHVLVGWTWVTSKKVLVYQRLSSSWGLDMVLQWYVFSLSRWRSGFICCAFFVCIPIGQLQIYCSKSIALCLSPLTYMLMRLHNLSKLWRTNYRVIVLTLGSGKITSTSETSGGYVAFVDGSTRDTTDDTLDRGGAFHHVKYAPTDTCRGSTDSAKCWSKMSRLIQSSSGSYDLQTGTGPSSPLWSSRWSGDLL